MAGKKAAPLELKAARLVDSSDLLADSRVAAKAASSAVCWVSHLASKKAVEKAGSKADPLEPARVYS